jgi:hypothetical protein
LYHTAHGILIGEVVIYKNLPLPGSQVFGIKTKLSGGGVYWYPAVVRKIELSPEVTTEIAAE